MKMGVLKYIASQYKHPILAELCRRLNPVYAAKRPEKEYLHTKSCPFCGRDVTVFKYHLLDGQIRGVVCMDRDDELYYKCSDYQDCKASRWDEQPKGEPYT